MVLIRTLLPRFKLTLEYEGTRYSGWQIQKNAETVQGKIQEAIHSVFATHEFELQGSGRTDSGVHALMQVAHLEVDTVLAPLIIRIKLNDELPADIHILDIEQATPKFHARHDAVARSYLYQISRRRTAFGKRYVWWIKDTLDINKMQECGKLFMGMKNYQSFTDDDPEEKSTKVLIDNVQMKDECDLILIRIGGSHFIWKMVRRIVGVIAEVGRGKLSLEDVKRFLATKSDEPAKLTAPPSGLFLEQVLYAGDKVREELVSTLRVSSRPSARKNR